MRCSERFSSSRSIKDKPDLGLSTSTPLAHRVQREGVSDRVLEYLLPTAVGLCGAWGAAEEHCYPLCLGWGCWLLSLPSEGSHTAQMHGFGWVAPPARRIVEIWSRLCSGILCHCLGGGAATASDG